ncbi:MAG: amidohydrolase family protein, partial [Clostridia bacterium]|nr:amidohydrolase family protein [Clostridia bacterium]
HKGICSESEWRPIARDIELSRKTGCHYHVCHISTKESVEIIRKAKKEGVKVTCETGPHYLVLNDMQIQEHGRFKMNPPIRSKEDQEALINGIQDGTIDMIITDHAPHSEEEKSKGLAGSSMGVVGLEVAFPVLYTNLVKKGIITLEKLIELMNTNPRKIFEIGTEIKVGERADLTVYDLNEEYDIDSSTFVSMGKATPFDGIHVFGKCKMTICNGKEVYSEMK